MDNVLWPHIPSLWAWGKSSGHTILQWLFSSLTMQPARDGPSLCRWTSVSITDPRYLKWSTFLSSSPSSVICNGFSLVDRCSVFAILIFRPFSVKIFYHDASLIWVSVPVMSIFARSSAYSSSHGSSDRISWDLLHIDIVRSWLRRIWPHWLPVVLSDSWLDSSSTNAFDDIMMASWWNGCCCFPINFNIATTFTGGQWYVYHSATQLGQAKGRLTLGAKFETLWNDFLSAWSWGQHSKVYRTTKNNQLLLLEKKLWAFESIGVGEREQMHFLTNSTL